jgi:protein-disulfide isomerase
MQNETKILIGVAAMVVVGGIALFAINPKVQEAGKSVDPKSLIRESSHMTGKADAKVSLVEFGDHQCPACAAVEPTLEKVKEKYKDNPNFNLVWRHFPLTSIHRNAVASSEASEAAGAQGKFWEMHKMLYERQQQWETQADPTTMFINYAKELGMGDIAKFESDLKNHIYRELVLTDLSDGEKLGISSTPTFFLNGEKLTFSNLPTEAELTQKIDELLK